MQELLDRINYSEQYNEKCPEWVKKLIKVYADEKSAQPEPYEESSDD